MRWDQDETIGKPAKRLRRATVRTARRPMGQREATNLLASFGMIAGLLLFWAMAVTL
jgi:hypothetical protein